MNWSWLIYLMCPLMMLPMMFLMMRGNHDGKTDNRPQVFEEDSIMGCCGNHNHEKKQSGLGEHKELVSHPKSHHWKMMICCILPIVLAAVFFLTKGASVQADGLVPLLLVLICPISHILMMAHLKHKKSGHSRI